MLFVLYNRLPFEQSWHQYTIDSRYHVVQYNTILHTAQQLRTQYFGPTSNSQKTSIPRPDGQAMDAIHYNDVIMSPIASQITSLPIVYSTVYSGTDQRKHQSSTSLAFVRGIHRGPVNSPHKWTVTRKIFPFDAVIMSWIIWRKVTARYRERTVPARGFGFSVKNPAYLRLRYLHI